MDYEKVLNQKIKEKIYKLDEAQKIFDYATNLQAQNLPVIFNRFHLALYLNVSDGFLKNITYGNNANNLYNTFQIPKKSGGFRTIESPKEKLKLIQVWIYKNILLKVPISCAAKAYVKGKSIIDNAKYHVKKENILKLDFKDFFPNINFQRVYYLFYDLGYTKGVAYLLAKLCCYQSRLAQGAPTSPYISNLCCRKLDKRLLIFCQKHGMCFTRYADDITISTNSCFNNLQLQTIKKIIKEEGFKINEKKTRLLHKNNRHLVTGIVVNKKLNVLKKIKNKLRQEIYFCKKYGVHNHLLHQGKVFSFYKEHLFGMAYYILMINKQQGLNFINQLEEISWDY